MFSNFIINQLAAEKTVPRIDRKKCLHGMRFLACKTCAQTCPSDAITFEKTAGKPAAPLMSSRCTGCGICAANCPTRCITLPGVNWEHIFYRSAAKPGLVLGCSKSGSMAIEETLPCAGALTGEFIAALCVARQFSPFAVEVSTCRSCMPKATWSLFRNLRKSRAMLTPQKPPVTLLFQAGQGELCSRRDAFSYLGKKLHHFTGGLWSSKTASPGNTHRSLLMNTLNQNPGAKVFLDSFKINSSCRACGRCQNLCPQKAWLIERETNAVMFFHDIEKCFGCNLCLSACPTGAVETKPAAWIWPGGKAGNSKRHVRTFEAVRCRTCNRQVVQGTGMDSSENRCLICQKRTALSPAGT